jgi:hypothetical protein
LRQQRERMIRNRHKRKEAEKQANQPAEMFAAAKARMEAEVDLVKADLAYRTAHVQLMSLIGKP